MVESLEEFPPRPATPPRSSDLAAYVRDLAVELERVALSSRLPGLAALLRATAAEAAREAAAEQWSHPKAAEGDAA